MYRRSCRRVHGSPVDRVHARVWERSVVVTRSTQLRRSASVYVWQVRLNLWGAPGRSAREASRQCYANE
jgi:hypothetical protein